MQRPEFATPSAKHTRRARRSTADPKYHGHAHDWIHKRLADTYFRKAKDLGYRTRAAFKIHQIDEKFSIFRRGQLVVDLGCYNGGWAQVIAERIKLGEDSGSRIIGMDLLAMDPVPNVEFVQGDLRQSHAVEQLVFALRGRRPDVVVSDMSPHHTGRGTDDALNALRLSLYAVDFARNVLKTGGWFVCKAFDSHELPTFTKYLETLFKTVVQFTPKASAAASKREVYLVCYYYTPSEEVEVRTDIIKNQRKTDMAGRSVQLPENPPPMPPQPEDATIDSMDKYERTVLGKQRLREEKDNPRVTKWRGRGLGRDMFLRREKLNP